MGGAAQDGCCPTDDASLKRLGEGDRATDHVGRYRDDDPGTSDCPCEHQEEDSRANESTGNCRDFRTWVDVQKEQRREHFVAVRRRKHDLHPVSEHARRSGRGRSSKRATKGREDRTNKSTLFGARCAASSRVICGVRQNENSLVVMPMDKQRGLESSKCPYARPVTAPRRSDVPSVTEAGR